MMTMSTNNPLSGHTDGTNDGLTDGSHILSPSLTNLYEAVHGNGILLPHDTAYDDNDRNDPPDLPGAITAGSNAYSFVVKACDVILDGVLYAIGGGSDITVTLTTTTAQKIGSFTALTTGQECLFVVLATADGLKVTQSDRITTAVGAYPSISGDAASYLKTGSGSGDNRQTVVLGTVRATFNASAVSANDLDITISERNDKRVFVRPTPLYLSPVRDGTVSSTTGINGHTALSTVHTGQAGTFGDNGVIWQSFNSAGESMLYYSRKDGSNRHTHLLGPTNIDVSSPSTNQTFTFDGDRVFVLTPSTGITLNPSGTFPPGHTVFVSVPSGSTVTFDSTGLSQAIAAGNALMFAYDGTNWKRVLFSSTVATTSSGASGVVQLSDGAGGFTSDSTLSYDTAANELTVDGKLTVTGLIDPTGLELTPQASNPAAADAGVVDANTLWLDSGASNRLKQGASGVMRAGDAISELNNDAGFVDAAGAASAAPATNLAYDAASRTVSSSTGTDAVITEVVSGGNSGLMTGAQATKLDGIAPSATTDQNAAGVPIADAGGYFTGTDVEAALQELGAASGPTYSDAQAIAAVEGEATLDLTGQVTMAQDLRVDGMVYQQFLDLTGDIPTGWHTIAVVEGRSGGAASGTGDSDQRAIGNFMVRNTDSSRHQSVTLTASHLFGAGNGNGISIEHASYFSTIGIDGFRLKENSTYDGAVLQISIANATNDIEVWLSNNYQYDGWTLIQPVADAVDPSTPTLGLGYDNAYSTFSAAATNMLTNIAGNGQSVQGTLEVKNDLLVTGDVGIGTTSPTNSLHVKTTETLGDAAYAARFQAAEGNVAVTRYGGIHINNDNTAPIDGAAWDTERWQISERDTDQFDIAHGTPSNTNVGASGTILRIMTNGRVGIGLGGTDPSQALHVSGTIRQTGVTSNVLVADANGDLVAASNLTDTAYSTTDTTDANVDTYAPLNLADWNMTPPTSTADALDRIAAWIAAVGPTLSPPGPPL
jgi:hypothetical protein